ncbi:MAG: DUF3168 domain-containing protein [Pseudomonadota bacterium]
MSYGAAAALQKAVYETLLADAGLADLVAGRIYDALPSGAVPETYVALGPEDVRDRSDKTGRGAEHRFTVSVVSEASGFSAVKTVAARIGDVLLSANPTLDRGLLVGIWFERATAKRSGPGGRLRRIDMRFRARVDNT